MLAGIGLIAGMDELMGLQMTLGDKLLITSVIAAHERSLASLQLEE